MGEEGASRSQPCITGIRKQPCLQLRKGHRPSRLLLVHLLLQLVVLLQSCLALWLDHWMLCCGR
jgi:hypothetical protein